MDELAGGVCALDRFFFFEAFIYCSCPGISLKLVTAITEPDKMFIASQKKKAFISKLICRIPHFVCCRLGPR